MQILLGILIASVFGCGSPDYPPEVFAPGRKWPGHKGVIVGLAFAPDGKTLATWGRDERLTTWDVETGRERWSVAAPGANFVRLAYAPDGSELAMNLSGSGVLAWDAASGQSRPFRQDPPRKPVEEELSVAVGWGIAYSPDGKAVIAGGSNGGVDGFVTLWDGSSAVGRDVAHQPSPVTSVAFSPDGKTIALASLNRSVRLWDRLTEKETAILVGHEKPVSGLAFTPDGSTLASSSFDRTVKLWETSSGRERATLSVHRDPVYALAIGPDGRFLASGDAKGLILLWDLATREPIARLLDHKGPIQAVAFAPSGKQLASAGDDGIIRLWTIPPARGGP